MGQFRQVANMVANYVVAYARVSLILIIVWS